MSGYRRDPVETAEALGPGGWLRTGDLAAMDADGYVRITGRKKELIINAAGQNMSPSIIEGAVESLYTEAGRGPRADDVLQLLPRPHHHLALATAHRAVVRIIPPKPAGPGGPSRRPRAGGSELMSMKHRAS